MATTRVATIAFNDVSLAQDPISAELMQKMFQGLPSDSKLSGMREVNGVLYLIIECPAFQEQPAYSYIYDLPRIEVFFMRDGNGKVYLSGMDFTKAMGLNVPPPPPKCRPSYTKYTGLNEVYNYCTNCGKKEGEHP